MNQDRCNVNVIYELLNSRKVKKKITFKIIKIQKIINDLYRIMFKIQGTEIISFHLPKKSI